MCVLKALAWLARAAAAARVAFSTLLQMWGVGRKKCLCVCISTLSDIPPYYIELLCTARRLRVLSLLYRDLRVTFET